VVSLTAENTSYVRADKYRNYATCVYHTIKFLNFVDILQGEEITVKINFDKIISVSLCL